MNVHKYHSLNPTILLIRGAIITLLCGIAPISITSTHAASDFPVYFAHSENRTWLAESGLSSHVAQVKELDSAGNAVVILSGLMLPAGSFLNPISDLGYENGVLWVAHRQTDASGNPLDAISAFDPDDPVSTFTTIASTAAQIAAAQAPERVTDVTPGEDPNRNVVVGTTTGLIVIVPGNIRGAPVPTEPPLEAGLVLPGEDPRRTAAGGASIDDLRDFVELPNFQRPVPPRPPDPVTAVTVGEDPRRTSGEGVSFPPSIITIPGTIQGTTPTRAPTPVTVITPGEDPARGQDLGPKQEQRKSVTILNVKKIKN